MKVTLKNTRLLLYLNVANVVAGIVIFCLLFITGVGVVANALLVVFFSTALLTLYYFVRIILFFGEPTSVMVAFTMLPIILSFNIILMVFPGLLGYADWLGILLLVVSVLVAFRSFFVKHSAIRLPFRLFGAGVGLIVVPRIMFLLVASNHSAEIINPLTDIGVLIVFSSTLFILKRAGDYLKNNGGAPFTDGVDADSEAVID